jgi:peptidoglycan LD-endopeptidase LytH
MGDILWPLHTNKIRRGMKNHTFGMVRDGGTSPHQGWDFYAAPDTTCYAIAKGTVVAAGIYIAGKLASTDNKKGFGKIVVIEFVHKEQTLYAAYCHLNSFTVNKNDPVEAGVPIGKTGNTGNAATMKGEDQHLHFEIRTTPFPGLGLAGRISPYQIYGMTPLTTAVVEPK